MTVLTKQPTNETLRADMWRACDILRRDNNVGGVMQYTEHLAWLLFMRFLDLEEKKRSDHDKLGRGAVWEGQIEPCVHQNHIFAVRFDANAVLPRFAEYEMQSWHARSYFLGVAKKTTNLATINRTKLGDFPLLYPLLPEQRRIVAELDAANAEITQLIDVRSADCAMINQLEQSILTQAFRGEL